MKLYFSPLSCSLAARIAIYEAGAAATFLEVDRKTKTFAGGHDFRTIHPLGLVPTLETDEGELLTESASILQHVADRHPHAELAPCDPLGRSRLHQWLSFIGTELHRGLFAPLLDEEAPEAVKAYVLTKAEPRLAHVATHLEGREHLLERFSVADVYLFTALNWSLATPVDLKTWPSLGAFRRRMLARAHVARAFEEERQLYMQQLSRASADAP